MFLMGVQGGATPSDVGWFLKPMNSIEISTRDHLSLFVAGILVYD